MNKFIKSMYKKYEYTALDRNIPFNLDLNNDFIPTVTQNCFYCNQEPELRHSNYGVKGSKYYYTYSAKVNGIDRIDSTLGYTYNNIVPCCKRCNQMKTDMSFESFKNHVLKLANIFQKSEFFP